MQGVIAMAPGTPGARELLATFPHAICLGETATYTIEVRPATVTAPAFTLAAAPAPAFASF